MKQGDIVRLADGRVGYYQRRENGRDVVLIFDEQTFDPKDVRKHEEWKVPARGGL